MTTFGVKQSSEVVRCRTVNRRRCDAERSVDAELTRHPVESIQRAQRRRRRRWLLPALQRKAATYRLVTKASAHESWPLHHDISNPPQLRLPSRKPLWRELEPADIKSQWRESWKSALVVNAHLLDDPTIRQPGFALPRQHWSLLNSFCTRQGHCDACKRK